MRMQGPVATGGPDAAADLLSLPGMTPERIQMLEMRLHVKTCADLKRALASGKVAGLKGFSRELRWQLQAVLAAEPHRPSDVSATGVWARSRGGPRRRGH